MLGLTSPEKSDLKALLARMNNRQQLGLDAREADQRRLIEFFLNISNKTAERYPGLHAALGKAAKSSAAPDGSADNARIIDLGHDAAGRATARGWHAARGGDYLSGATTLVLDADSLEPLALGADTQVGGTRAASATRSHTARPGSPKQTAVTFYHGQHAPDDAPRFGVVSATQQAQLGLAGILVTAPVSAVHAVVSIALGRMPGWNNQDVTYHYNDTANINSPMLLVPFTGNGTLPYTIAGVNSNLTIQGLVTTSQLYVNSVAAYVTPVSGMDLNTPVTAASQNSNTVNWNFPFDGQPQASTKSIRYNPQGNANDFTTVSFFFQFDVPVNNPTNPVYTFTVCSFDWPDQPSTQCTQIQNLGFLWHCLAAGTKIKMADGSSLAIDGVNNTMHVATGLGKGALAVEATTVGRHEEAPGPLSGVRRLLTQKGNELVLTAYHPVLTPDGLVMALDLRPGDAVITEQGTDQVKSCEPTSYNGLVYNLKLGDFEDRKRGLVHTVGTFFANGIAVGDHLALAHQYVASRHDVDYMLARLPADVHKDYQNALHDIAAR